MAAAGSAVAILLLDLVARKGGEPGLEKMISRKRFEYLKTMMSARAGYRIALACVAPPPFPSTPIIAAASAFQYSRRKLLSLGFVSRLARFSIVLALAVIFGRQILSIARSTAFF
jgi:membrane protein YqaA with SNARE-associated domain